MGLTNLPSNLLDQITQLRAELAELRKRPAAVPPPVQFSPVRAQDLPVVTAAEFETVWAARLTVLCPLLTLDTLDGCEAGTSGEGQILITDESTGQGAVVASWACAPGLVRTSRGPYALTGTRLVVAVRYRRTSGTGSVRAAVTDSAQQRG
ncbi:hypothetical protein GCM10010174_22900 [Kutzneria viridogrisea]|uniref:Uncharacterized protein n=1 Tax=Kutzneria viridogrisea TaxID=47990 RepID=A0ABR6BTK5_9PSEU|nr:hypothetical protein [Kutzneria viridogrisea]